MKKLAICFLSLAIILTTGCGALPTSKNVVASATTLSTPSLKTPEVISQTDDSNSNTLVYGCVVPPTGDFCKATELKNSTDSQINSLIDDASIIAIDMNGNYVVNKGVCEGFHERMNPDGSKTFSIKLRSGLKYNDGTPVEAKDYLVPLLIYGASYADSLGVERQGAALMGSDEYYSLSSPCFSGIRLIDVSSFELTVKADRLPYYYDILYANTYPMNIAFWLSHDADVQDDGTGAYLSGLKGVDDIRAKLEAARWQTEGRVSCGPYSLSDYNAQSHSVVLTRNVNYLGNYEGVKPSIETIVFECVKADEAAMKLINKNVDIVDPVAISQMPAVDAYIKENRLVKHTYSRNGYAKLLYQCDIGPTKYASVRRAIAFLLDRNKLVDEYCKGSGTVINGPYSKAMWMYSQMKERIFAELNQYQYNVDRAMLLLDEDGWVFDEAGNTYTSGIRYRLVDESSANDRCVTLPDGRILMPLIIDWCSTDDNQMADMIEELLDNSPNTALAGMKLVHERLPLNDMLSYLYRENTVKYCMFCLATDYNAAYDYSYTFTLDPQLRSMGYNLSYASDERLNRLSMEMVNTVNSSDSAAFAQKWFEFVKQFNEYLPELPLYSNDYQAVCNARIVNYNPNALFGFPQAVLYAKIEN